MSFFLLLLQKRCHPEEKMETYNPASFVYSDWKTINGHVQNTASENGGFTFSKREMHNHSGRSGHSGLFGKGPNFRAKYNNNANKQHQQRKKEQKNQHQLKHSQRNGHHETRRTSGRGGRDYKHKVQVICTAGWMLTIISLWNVAFIVLPVRFDSCVQCRCLSSGSLLYKSKSPTEKSYMWQITSPLLKFLLRTFRTNPEG